MNIFKKFLAYLRLNEAVRQADKAHTQSGHRYYVMPNGNSDKLVIMDRTNFRILKQKGYLPGNVTITDLNKECFYCTPYKNGSDGLSPDVVALKRSQYFNWLKAVDKLDR